MNTLAVTKSHHMDHQVIQNQLASVLLPLAVTEEYNGKHSPIHVSHSVTNQFKHFMNEGQIGLGNPGILTMEEKLRNHPIVFIVVHSPQQNQFDVSQSKLHTAVPSNTTITGSTSSLNPKIVKFKTKSHHNKPYQANTANKQITRNKSRNDNNPERDEIL